MNKKDLVSVSLLTFFSLTLTDQPSPQNCFIKNEDIPALQDEVITGVFQTFLSLLLFVLGKNYVQAIG